MFILFFSDYYGKFYTLKVNLIALFMAKYILKRLQSTLVLFLRHEHVKESFSVSELLFARFLKKLSFQLKFLCITTQCRPQKRHSRSVHGNSIPMTHNY